MTEKTPTVVALYHWGADSPERVAEFRLKSDGDVVLTVLNPNQAGIAVEMYESGVELRREGRYISWRDDSHAFMRALLQPFRMTYNWFRDESGDTPIQK